MAGYKCSQFELEVNKLKCNDTDVVMDNGSTKAHAEVQSEVPAEDEKDNTLATKWAFNDNFKEFHNIFEI